MNIQQAKALFFSQYLGQEVLGLITDVTDIFFIDFESLNINMSYFKDSFLILKSVKDLNDTERLNIGIVAFPMFVPFPEKDHDTLRKLALTVLDRGHLGSRTHQALVRYGVLTPFTYLNENNQPVTLQPDELISKGWAKIELQEGKK
jgi:hypothetical protein